MPSPPTGMGRSVTAAAAGLTAVATCFGSLFAIVGEIAGIVFLSLALSALASGLGGTRTIVGEIAWVVLLALTVTALAGDLTLLVLIHRCKAATRRICSLLLVARIGHLILLAVAEPCGLQS